MLELVTEEQQEGLAEQNKKLSVVLSAETFTPIVLQLPPAAELSAIRDLYFDKVSAQEVSSTLTDDLKDFLKRDLDRLISRAQHYNDSPTFLNHLATLHEFSGDVNGSVHFLREGLKVDSSSHCRHRLGRALIGLNNLTEAESVFRGADLNADVDAILGLACIEVLNSRWNRASEYVKAALGVDSEKVPALLLAGILELQAGNAGGAIAYFRSATEDLLISTAPQLLLGIAYGKADKRKKAIDAFRRAVAINPVDETSVIFLTDALMREKRYADVLQILETFTQYEQKSAVAWDRLARASFELGENAKALTALRHQASISATSGVWNNMGIVYWRMRNYVAALRYLSMAVETMKKEGYQSYLPLYNAFIFLRQIGKLDEALKLAELIPDDRWLDLASKLEFAKLIAARCEALAEAGKTDEAESELERWLAWPEKSKTLHLALLQTATFFYSLVKPNHQKAMHCSEWALDEASQKSTTREVRASLLNNVAFVFLETGRIREAEDVLRNLAPWIHKTATVTATLGLLQLKKGHVDKGKALYLEAIALSVSDIQKRRLKQKMRLEIGKSFLAEGKPRSAIRYLKKAKFGSSGLTGLDDEASGLLEALDNS